jgi:hypothetical protein
MAQVAEPLSYKSKVPSSNPSTFKTTPKESYSHFYLIYVYNFWIKTKHFNLIFCSAGNQSQDFTTVEKVKTQTPRAHH